jgi:hypothetical protein
MFYPDGVAGISTGSGTPETARRSVVLRSLDGCPKWGEDDVTGAGPVRPLGHLCWYKRWRSSGIVKFLRGAKDSLAPRGIRNLGVLFDWNSP